MKQFIHLLISFTLIFFVAKNNLAQELSGVFKTNLEIRGNNSNDMNDESGMSSIHQRTAEEKELIDQIQQLRQTDDRSILNQILNLESQLEAIAPNVVSQPAPYIGGGVAPAVAEKNSFVPEAIGNTEIFSSGTKFVSSLATATEQRGSTAGRMWVAFSVRTTGARDTLRVFYSDDQGMNWNYYAYAWLGGTDQISYDEMDMEIIENTTGEKYVWIVYGYRNDAGAGRYRSGGLIVQSPTFQGNLFSLSWPGDDATKRYYRPRITSDNSWYSSLAYVYMVASFDSLVAGTSRNNTQKTLRCTDPYTTTPIFQYKGDRFWWNTTTDYMVDLHSDIAYFRNSSDSIIVSYSNIPDTTSIFFAKSDINNGPGTSDGAGGFIGGSNPGDHKQYARLSSNGNDNGSVICVFRQRTNNVWRITYYRTLNYGNFNSMNQAVLQGSLTSDSYQPDIVGVRNQDKHYFSWRLDGSPDSARYIGTNILGNWPQNVGMMNGQTSTSGIVGIKPGFRYADNDSCFVIYTEFGPYNVWAAYGCSGPVGVEDDKVIPANYSLAQNYPNPFNPSTTIKYSIPNASLVKIKVFNTIGQEMAVLVNQEQSAGVYEVKFDASSLTSGIYFYRIEAGNFIETKKMILIK